MLLASFASLLLFATPAALDNIREQRSFGLAFAPAMTVRDGDALIMPVGLAIDWALTPRWTASLALSLFPFRESITNVHVGARRYLFSRSVSPYVSLDIDLENDEIESGEMRRSAGLLGGVGLEWAFQSGFLMALDACVGPRYIGWWGLSVDDTWDTFVRTRLMVGARF